MEAKKHLFFAGSEARREKEQAIHNRFITRLEKGLQKIQKSCASGRPKNANIIERRIGRLLERFNRASPLFDIVVKERDGRTDLSWTIHDTYSDWARLSEGHYLLRTNIKDWTPEDLWKAYIQLTEAEAAFRIHKQDLKLRPITAPTRGPCAGPHPGVLPCLCALEMHGPIVQAGRSRQRTTHRYRRDQNPDVSRCCYGNTQWNRNQTALRLQAGRPSGSPPSETPLETTGATGDEIDNKCSENFLNLLPFAA